MATFKKRTGWFCWGVSAFAWMAFMASFSTPAHAELIASDTAHAIPGWFATEDIHFIEQSLGKIVDGSIDYAVYAPGNFNLSFPGQDPSGGTQYVYRYQLHNNAGTSTDNMLELTVGLVGITNAANCEWIEPTSGPYLNVGVAPSSSQVGLVGGPPPTSANWGYKASAAITPGNYSKMLIFTSPYGPTFQSATVLSQSTDAHGVDNLGNQYNSWEGLAPSPVPEPSSFFSFLAIGGSFIVYRVLRRK